MMTIEQRLKLLSVPQGPIDMVLDTDAYNEIDDQYAIAYAMQASEKLNLKAIYAAPFKNSHAATPAIGMESSYQEILNLMNLMGREMTVLRGSTEFMTDEHTPVLSDAAEDLAKRAMEYSAEKPLYVAAIGAITNVASALLLQPEIAERIVVVFLGGNALDWPDNVEFNLWEDVAAARVVYDSGAPLVLLPCMGVVDAFTTTEPELRHWLGGKNALCDYLIQHTVNTANSYAEGKVWSRPIWDVTAIGWLLNDEGSLMLDKLIPTPIPEYDHQYAHNPNRPLCRYVYSIKRDQLLRDLFARIGG